MKCPHIPEISYDEFSKRIHIKSLDKQMSTDGAIEVTYRCNLKCAHCFVSFDNNTNVSKELPYQEICDIIDQIVQEGCIWLVFTGGEPLIREDFLDIYTYAKKKGLLIILYTNGTLITPETAHYLQVQRPLLVEITVYGITPATYESVTGVPGSFSRCMEGIKLLLENRIPLNLKTVVMTLNKHEVWQMKKWAEGLGVGFRSDPLIFPRIDGSKEPCILRISPKEVVEFGVTNEKEVERWRKLWQKGWTLDPSDYLYICDARRGSFFINPYGELSLCELSRYPSYDLRRGTFKEGWHNIVSNIRLQKPTGDYKCGRCKLRFLCNQCPGWAQLENGDQEKLVEYLCQIAHLKGTALESLSSNWQTDNEQFCVGVKQ